MNQDIECLVEAHTGAIPKFTIFETTIPDNVVIKSTITEELIETYSGGMLLADLNNQPEINITHLFALTSTELSIESTIYGYSLHATEAGTIEISVIY